MGAHHAPARARARVSGERQAWTRRAHCAVSKRAASAGVNSGIMARGRRPRSVRQLRAAVQRECGAVGWRASDRRPCARRCACVDRYIYIFAFYVAFSTLVWGTYNPIEASWVGIASLGKYLAAVRWASRWWIANGSRALHTYVEHVDVRSQPAARGTTRTMLRRIAAHSNSTQPMYVRLLLTRADNAPKEPIMFHPLAHCTTSALAANLNGPFSHPRDRAVCCAAHAAKR